MESFMKAADDLDLDKLLDDFEKSEGFGPASVPGSLKSIPKQEQNGHGTPIIQNGIRGKDTVGQQDIISYESDLLIDLSEADFAPAVQSSTILASLTPGVLQPEKPRPHQDGMEDDSNTQLRDTDFSSYLHKDTTVDTLEGLNFQAGPAPSEVVSPTVDTVKPPVKHGIPQTTTGSAHDEQTPPYTGPKAEFDVPRFQVNSSYVPQTHSTPQLYGTPHNNGTPQTLGTPGRPDSGSNVVVASHTPIITDKDTASTPPPGTSSPRTLPASSVIEVPSSVSPVAAGAPWSREASNTQIQEITTENSASFRAEIIPAGITDAQLLDPSQMKKYLQQGARPKVQASKALDQPDDPSTPKPVGFGDAADISVSEEDLEALEAEMKTPQGETHPVTTTQQGDQGHSRVSPISKLLNQEQVPQGLVGIPTDNELANLDPFLQGNQGVSQPGSTPGHGPVDHGSSEGGQGHTHLPVNNHSQGSTLTQGQPLTQSSTNPQSHPQQLGHAQDVSNLQRSGGSQQQMAGDFQSSRSNPQISGEETIPTHPQTHMEGPAHDHQMNGMGLMHGDLPTGRTQPQANGETYIPVQNPFSLGETEQPSIPASQIDEEVRPLPAESNATRSQGPSALPPDPPSYQQVQEWKAAELERNNGVLREGLTLDFNQPVQPGGVELDQRRVGHQHLPPSPIVEEVGVTTGFVRDGHSSRRRHQRRPDEQRQQQQQQEQQSHQQQPPQGNTEEGLMVNVGGVPVRLGDVAPVWIPDTDAASCMKCDLKFTFTKRRHHCRACGKVFCMKCCNVRVKLKYMMSREARVCNTCLNAILTAEAMQRVSDAIQSNENSPEHSSADTQEQQQGEEEHPASPRPVLRQPSIDGSQRPRESRRVRFSDGVPPGLDRGEPDGSTQPRTERSSRRRLSRQRGSKSFIPESEGSLPPRLLPSGTGDFRVVENPKVDDVMTEIRNEAADPVTFLLSKALQVHIKIVNLNCCVNRVCWCFTTKGLATVGQDEIVFVLECLPDETNVPRDMLLHIYNLYLSASKGNTVQHLGHCVFTHNFLDSREHAGFLYLRPTYQCQQKLILPEQPYLYGILLQKWEIPWAKIFPVRLMLRLGAEFRYYPCPLMSVRFRKPVFQEIGHTIMNLLADFKNYQYMLPLIRGVVVHMQDHETIIHLPKNRYDDVMKVINNSNEHVMAIAANFSPEADSHLVCIQNDQGVYQTQAINRQNKPRKVTGASFMVLNGALKSNSGLTAKSSIVEDGLMVQIRPEMMASLRDALRNMADFTIPCGSTESAQPEETVILRWVADDTSFNSGVKSPVDGRPLEGVESIRIQNTTDFQGQSKIIRWTEVFFIENGGGSDSRKHIPEPVDLSRLAENLAIAFCLALSESLQDLHTLGLNKLALRVTVDLENVGYEVGSGGNPLPDQYMNNLDDLLIPVLHNAVSQQEGGPVVLELIFYILD